MPRTVSRSISPCGPRRDNWTSFGPASSNWIITSLKHSQGKTCAKNCNVYYRECGDFACAWARRLARWHCACACAGHFAHRTPHALAAPPPPPCIAPDHSTNILPLSKSPRFELADGTSGMALACGMTCDETHALVAYPPSVINKNIVSSLRTCHQLEYMLYLSLNSVHITIFQQSS
ncbi:hypothetical protein RR48_09138 [Papilio machaon]|uniref:Uncharacterized protein n=1 Tax=Papilio machaon TaxID=76193 RepID=A0A194RGQ6_PAPMA|nr:hypothetical protein RR48_09138 [Papilio machaon]